MSHKAAANVPSALAAPASRRHIELPALANWRAPSQYQFPEWMPASGWAWEFLRRNPDYQADYLTYLQHLLCVVPDAEIDAKTACCVLSDAQMDLVESSESMRHFEPEKHDGENLMTWLQRVGMVGRTTPLDSWLGQKWGITQIVSPFANYLQSNIYFRRGAPRKPPINATCRELDRCSKVMTLTFDLTMPIAPQIEAAERWLLSEQYRRSEKGEFASPVSARMHTDKFPLYLRTFDAVTSGATREEIAAELAPDATNEYPDFAGNKTIANWYRAAERMVKSGYRKLPPL